MKHVARALALMSAIGVAAVVATSGGAQAPGAAQPVWSECCGAKPWNQGRTAADEEGEGGSRMVHNRMAMTVGIPPAYAGLRNPLPRTRATIRRGANVYVHYCAACHGETGHGDGRAGRALVQPPASLARLSRMAISHWDPFMYWAVTEGGASLHTAMPAFKDSLPKEDRWAVVAYIQARLPRSRSR
jgi:mono/diheme cytochrome c family protein